MRTTSRELDKELRSEKVKVAERRLNRNREALERIVNQVGAHLTIELLGSICEERRINAALLDQ